MRKQTDETEPVRQDEEQPTREPGWQDEGRPVSESGADVKKHELKGWLISLAAAIVIALALRFFVFEFIRVDGPSMEPTLYTDEYVFMERVTYWFRTPLRGDIVICSFPGSSESFVKRIIGLPGERISVKDGVLYIDGVPNYEYYEGYIDEGMDEVTVPEDSVIVMGDNRNKSRDSRSVGSIEYKGILGKALFVIWPLDKIHGL